MKAKEQRHAEWMKRIVDFRESGMTMKAWCATQQLTLDQMKYWIRKQKQCSQPDNPRFIPLTVSPPASLDPSDRLLIRVGGVSIELQPGFNPELLRQAVKALEVPC